MSRVFSIVFSLFWIGCISVGFYQVYLFINGYPLFTIAKKEEQKGYVSISSFPISSFYMNYEWIGSGDIHVLHLLGSYTMCAQKLGYHERCFANSIVSSNDQEMLHYRDIILLPHPLNIRTITEEKTYILPSQKGFFWYDTAKKQIYWIDSNSSQLHSLFLSFEPDIIDFNESENSFYAIQTKTKNMLEKREKITAGSLFFPLPNVPSFYQSLFIRDNILSESLPVKTLGMQPSVKILAQFTEEIEDFFPLFSSKNIIIVFPNSVVLFSADAKDFRFLFSKDPKTPVLYFGEVRQFWFIHENNLKLLQI